MNEEEETNEDVGVTFEESVAAGEEVLSAYNSGVAFTMKDQTITVDTSDVVDAGGFGSMSIGLKVGLIGGSAAILIGAVVAFILLRRR